MSLGSLSWAHHTIAFEDQSAGMKVGGQVFNYVH